MSRDFYYSYSNIYIIGEDTGYSEISSARLSRALSINMVTIVDDYDDLLGHNPEYGPPSSMTVCLVSNQKCIIEGNDFQLEVSNQ